VSLLPKTALRSTLRSLNSAIPLADLAFAGQRVWQMQSYFRDLLSIEEARTILRCRLERREVDFLDLARHSIYGHSGSVYLALLRLIGCEEGDLRRLVMQEGVEGALGSLLRQGVYLSVDELKGAPVIRGSARLRLDASALHNPRAVSSLVSRGHRARNGVEWVPTNLPNIRDRAVNAFLSLDARGGSDWVKGVWGGPGGSLGVAIRFSGFSAPTARCFVLVDPTARALHPRYRWSEPIFRLGSALAGVPLPRQQFVPIEQPLPVVGWMSAVLGAGRVPHLWTFVSPAVRLCQAALEHGIDIRGSQFTLTGEPVTAARRDLVQRAGAEVLVDYGSKESGFLAHGCQAPEAPDDVHLFHDLNALVQAQPEDNGPGIPAGALLVTSLRLTAPLILLNVSMGDQAVMGRRACGCPLEQLG
jgi:hypothetical protein